MEKFGKVIGTLPGDNLHPAGYYLLDDGRVLPRRRKPTEYEEAKRRKAMLACEKLSDIDLDVLMITAANALADDNSKAARRLAALMTFSVWANRKGVVFSDVEGIMEEWGRDDTHKTRAKRKTREVRRLKQKLAETEQKRDAKVATVGEDVAQPAVGVPTGITLPGDVS